MNLYVAISIPILLLVVSVPSTLWGFQIVSGMLLENGTCNNENLMTTSNKTININGTVDDFLKSLPSDNTILAEIVCN
jgi:hypothetical protein